MLDPPEHVSADDVLACAREHWAPGAEQVTHLAVGFGAHHWRTTGPDIDLFVTFDGLLPRHTPTSLEGAYSAALDLAGQGLEFVLAGKPSRSGTMTVPLLDGALSAVAWRQGHAGPGPFASSAQADAWATRLARLHAAVVPPTIPRWRPLVPATLAEQIESAVAAPWPAPFGETARAAVAARVADIARWTAAYHRLAATSDPEAWVVTHGEPHTRNILHTPEGELLVDWESAKLAPRERDLATLLETGLDWLLAYGGPPPANGLPSALDWAAVEMFDLEWRLDEINQYATWFQAPHVGNRSDREALGGLMEELARPEWRRPD